MTNKPGEIISLLETEFVTQQTSDVLKARLNKITTVLPVFFDEETFADLRLVSDRLIPQEQRENKIDLPGMLDEALLSGNGNGWRYDCMPPDEKAFVQGLQGINQTAGSVFGKSFSLLTIAERDFVLSTVQNGTAQAEAWNSTPAEIFFKELLAALVELYYSHPSAKEEIGDVSFADARGWQHPGLNVHKREELNNKDDRQ